MIACCSAKIWTRRKSSKTTERDIGFFKFKIQPLLLGSQILNPYSQHKKPSWENLSSSCCVKSSFSFSCFSSERKAHVTAGDDGVWYVWNSENNVLFISNCCFHTRGSLLNISSVDRTICAWNFLQSKCSLELKGHLDVVLTEIFILIAKQSQQMKMISARDFMFLSKVKAFQFSEVWSWYQLL
jgi:WD40 repeat protein